jgi:4-oxalocrotonate tautomerase
MPYANIKIPAGLINGDEKAVLIARVADALASVFGPQSRATTMILVEDVAAGGYYRANEIITAEIIRSRSAAKAVTE